MPLLPTNLPYDRPRDEPQPLAAALAKIEPKTIEVVPRKENELRFTVQSVDLKGAQLNLDVVVDNNTPFERWGPLVRAAVLKQDPKSKWSEHSLMTIINAIIYGDRLGLSVEEGDLYVVGGNVTRTAQAFIKTAFATGKVKNYSVKTEVKIKQEKEIISVVPEKKEGELYQEDLLYKIENASYVWVDIDSVHEKEDELIVEIAWQNADKASGIAKVPALRCTVVVEEKSGIVHRVVAPIEEWYVGSNISWQKRPRYMLENNAKGKAFSMVRPGGEDMDSYEPVAS